MYFGNFQWQGCDAMAVDVAYHGGLGGIGIGSAMVVGVSNLEAT